MIQYRLATVEDAPALAEIRWDFRLEESAGQTIHEKSQFLQACSTFMADGIRRGEWWFWVAADQSTLVACICILIVRKIPKPNKLVDGFGYVTEKFTAVAHVSRGANQRIPPWLIALAT